MGVAHALAVAAGARVVSFGDWSPRRPPEGGFVRQRCVLLGQNEAGRTSFSSPERCYAACGGFGGKGIGFAALSLSSARTSFSSPGRCYAACGGFGGKGIRTPGLLIANETLYQLSYTPEKESNLSIVSVWSQGRKKPPRARAAVFVSGLFAWVRRPIRRGVSRGFWRFVA